MLLLVTVVFFFRINIIMPRIIWVKVVEIMFTCKDLSLGFSHP